MLWANREWNVNWEENLGIRSSNRNYCSLREGHYSFVRDFHIYLLLLPNNTWWYWIQSMGHCIWDCDQKRWPGICTNSEKLKNFCNAFFVKNCFWNWWTIYHFSYKRTLLFQRNLRSFQKFPFKSNKNLQFWCCQSWYCQNTNKHHKNLW